jgi:hypothetical protein
MRLASRAFISQGSSFERISRLREIDRQIRRHLGIASLLSESGRH